MENFITCKQCGKETFYTKSECAFCGVALNKATNESVTTNDTPNTDKKVNEKVELKPAEQVVPGNTVIYTITATNTGDSPAENIVIKEKSFGDFPPPLGF